MIHYSNTVYLIKMKLSDNLVEIWLFAMAYPYYLHIIMKPFNVIAIINIEPNSIIILYVIDRYVVREGEISSQHTYFST